MFATEKLIKMALEEDLGSGDVTTLSTVPPDTQACALIKAKQECVAAGIQVLGLVFRALDPALKIEARVADGGRLKVGDPIMVVSGNVISILMAERVALNFVQRLCGVATLTSRFVAAVEDFPAEIVDTRKTTPGWRSLEKYAVQVGGARNHRHGLFDGILIKDNHIRAAGTITDASGRTLSGQTVAAFWNSVRHAKPACIGLNCALGATELRPWLQELSKVAECPVSVHPNAGLPNELGEYDDTPEQMSAVLAEFAADGLINLAGGCCGTRPEHIKAIADALSEQQTRTPPKAVPYCRLSGLEPLTLSPDLNFVNVGERTNVTGSAIFSKNVTRRVFAFLRSSIHQI